MRFSEPQCTCYKRHIKYNIKGKQRRNVSKKANTKCCYSTSNLIIGIEQQRVENSSAKLHSNFMLLQLGTMECNKT